VENIYILLQQMYIVFRKRFIKRLSFVGDISKNILVSFLVLFADSFRVRCIFL